MDCILGRGSDAAILFRHPAGPRSQTLGTGPIFPPKKGNGRVGSAPDAACSAAHGERGTKSAGKDDGVSTDEIGRACAQREGERMDFRIAGRTVEPVPLVAGDKEEAIGKLADIIAARHGLAPAAAAAVREAALRREASLSTGMEKGVAVPHGILPGDAAGLLVAAGVLADPVEWGTLDGSPVEIVFLFAVPEGRLKDYQRALGEVMGLLMDPERRRALVRRANEGLST